MEARLRIRHRAIRIEIGTKAPAGLRASALPCGAKRLEQRFIVALLRRNQVQRRERKVTALLCPARTHIQLWRPIHRDNVYLPDSGHNMSPNNFQRGDNIWPLRAAGV